MIELLMMPCCRRVAVCAALLLLAGCGGNVNDDESRALLTLLVSRSTGGEVANHGAYEPVVSTKGRYIAFKSYATNLVAGAASGNHIYFHDSMAGTTVLLPNTLEASTGGLSGDGRFFTYTSSSGEIMVHDLQKGSAVRIDLDNNGQPPPGPGSSLNSSISWNGRFVVFESTIEADQLVNGAYDYNGSSDIYVRDRDTDEDGIYDEPGLVLTSLISVSTTSTQTSILTSIFPSEIPSISSNGRFVTFESVGSDLVSGFLDGNDPGETDVFLRDRDTDGDGIFDEEGAVETILVSATTGTTSGNGASDVPFLSAGGNHVIFHSQASDLVPGDTNQAPDAFVWNRNDGTITRVSISSSGDEASNGVFSTSRPCISGDGRYTVFISNGLSSKDRTSISDAYKHDLWTGTTVIESVSTGSTVQDEYGPFGVIISSDGSTIVFVTAGVGIVEDYSGGNLQVYRRGKF
jgi:hypothetical protein